jgi:hypothetical protein
MTKKRDCDFVNDLLIKQNCGDKLFESEIEIIKDHLSRCEECREYDEIVKTIAGSQELQSVDLTSVEKAVKNAMLASGKKTIPLKLPKLIRDLIMGFFRYRIPVYQSVLAVCIALLFIYQITMVSNNVSGETSKMADSLVSTVIPEKFSYCIDNIDIIESQRVGESVEEDSSLLKFTYTVF